MCTAIYYLCMVEHVREAYCTSVISSGASMRQGGISIHGMELYYFFVTVDTSEQIHDSHDMVITLDSAINRSSFGWAETGRSGLVGVRVRTL